MILFKFGIEYGLEMFLEFQLSSLFGFILSSAMIRERGMQNEKYRFSNLIPLLKSSKENKKEMMKNGIRDLKLL